MLDRFWVFIQNIITYKFAVCNCTTHRHPVKANVKGFFVCSFRFHWIIRKGSIWYLMYRMCNAMKRQGSTGDETTRLWLTCTRSTQNAQRKQGGQLVQWVSGRGRAISHVRRPCTSLSFSGISKVLCHCVVAQEGSREVRRADDNIPTKVKC